MDTVKIIDRKQAKTIAHRGGNLELENTIESVAGAKGFPEVCAYINEDAAVITVRASGLDQTKTATLCEIVTETANIGMDKVKIIEVK